MRRVSPRVGTVGLWLGVWVALAAGDEPVKPPAASPPEEWKLTVRIGRPSRDETIGVEIASRKGRIHRFLEDSPEVISWRPDGAVTILDLRRKVQVELTAKQRANALDELKGMIRKSIEKRVTDGGKANRVAARMSRDLIEPKFEPKFDPATKTLTVSNSSVTVEVTGVEEPDPARRRIVADVLRHLAELDALRNPAEIPPFARLEAIEAFAQAGPFRPTRMKITTRLAGPPMVVRWQFDFTGGLSAQEQANLDAVELVRAEARFVRMASYENKDAGAPTNPAATAKP